MLLKHLPVQIRAANNKLRHSVLSQDWLSAGLVAISIIVAGRLAFIFASVHDITPVWPPSGIALAALLLLGRRVWWGVLLGFWIADTTWFHSVPIGSFMSLGETSETLIAAFIIHRLFGHHDILGRAQHVLYFVLAATLAPIGNSTLGTLVLYFHQLVPESAYLEVWRTWWTADTVGILLFTPLLTTWIKQFPKIRQFSSKKAAELALLTFSVILTSEEVFGRGYPLEYLFLPLVVWSAFRFGKQGTTLMLVSISIISILATAQGSGTFAQSSQNESLLLLQSFVGVIAVTALILSAVLVERETAEEQLKDANETLEHRVEQRTTQLSQTLANLRRTQAQLVQTEKMSSLGQMVAGVAHEINNPINFIYGNLTPAREYAQDLLQLLELYQQEYPHPSASIQAKLLAIDLEFLQADLPKLLNSMTVGSQRIQDIVKSLRNFSRLDEAHFKTVDIHEGIDSTLMILQNRLRVKPGHPGIEVTKNYCQLSSVTCYPGELNQVFMNILSNAIDSLEDRMEAEAKKLETYGSSLFIPTITIQTSVVENNRVAISITDNGTGMSKEVCSKLFDPFYTTKPVGIGTGLGLSISYQIVVERHNGELLCHSVLGQGSEFLVKIPIHQTCSSGIS